MAQAQNYTLGRGKVYFARFKPGTQTPGVERYIGNTPEFSLTIEEEKLDHFSSDAGIREKDDSISLEVNRSGSLTTDSIQPENVALFFFGENTILADAGGSIVDEVVDADGVVPGGYYQLGTSDSRPSGARMISAVVVKDDATAPTTFTVDDDYTVDLATGRLYIVPAEDGGTIAEGDVLEVSYTIAASSRDRIISGSQPVEGALRFVADNPKGPNKDYFMPWVQITPNGDYALKGDEWQTIPFSMEILKRTTREAIYVDGRAYTP